MKGSLIILAFFIAGALLGYSGITPEVLSSDTVSAYALYFLLFIVGVGIGFDTRCWRILREMHIKVLLVPVFIMLGTFAGALATAPFIPGHSIRDVLAVGAGFGYYSLSSIMISQMGDTVLGSIALLSNIIRELITLLAAPLFVRYFGKLGPLASGGATAMDTTLPIITRFSGERYGIIAVFSGMFLTVAVPFMVSAIMSW
jgi:uncharacterized membrane protein YbjE (DUF340 family)